MFPFSASSKNDESADAEAAASSVSKEDREQVQMREFIERKAVEAGFDQQNEFASHFADIK